MIGCADSRVSPEVIFDARPGELFVVRNVANLVPPYAPDGQAHGVSAALEFGVAALKVQHIVVLGHAQCGGVKAFAEDAEPLSPGDFIGKWMSLMAPAMEKVGPRGELSRDRLPDTARTGERRQQPRQPADVSAAAQAGRDGPASRSMAPISASRPGACRCAIPRPASSGRSRWKITRGCLRSRAALICPRPVPLSGCMRVTPPSLRLDQLAIDQALGDLHRVERRALAQIVGDDPHRRARSPPSRPRGCG